MDQARTTITKIFNGTEGAYTRFLTQNMEEDSSHVEMKLSSDADEEVGGNGVVDHGKQHHVRPTYSSKAGLCNPRNICIATTVAIITSFLIGLLIGSSMYKKTTEQASSSCTAPASAPSSALDDETIPVETVRALDWSDITALLKRKLTTSGIDQSLREFSREDHKAGSPGDEILANKVFSKFKDNGMEPWIDTHFVKVQDLPKSVSNKVTFRGRAFSESGYLSYSAAQSVQGAVLYAYYGREDDLRHLQDIGIDMNGRVLLIRAGKNSYAEKVANAVKVNASAVLIYPYPADYQLDDNNNLFGHVHLGSGDPYTPGFPSFNHTQFPPVKSSGLPSIPAQTIKASTAAAIMKDMRGRAPPHGWADGDVEYKLGDINDTVFLEVNNVLTEIQIHNVFGVIKGLVDPDRYVVIGAQRDAWGSGFAASTVGTSLLLELARVITSMIREDGFQPRRSIVFASWSAGEYGAVGATEWLEGYLPSLNMKAFSYISLDGVVTGSSLFKASASPMMYDLIQRTLNEVSSPTDPNRSLFAQVAGANWEAAVMEPMRMDDAAYPFLAFSGIPSVSFRFTQDKQYPFFGTLLDTRKNLESKAPNLPAVVKAAGEVAGQMALRLVHDHLLRLNTEKYLNIMRIQVSKINKDVMNLQRNGRLPKTLQVKWFMSAIGSYGRASRSLISTIQNSDLDDMEQCRIINDRIMAVERDLLSPYVSPRDTPFRHILLGSGSCTIQDVLTQLAAIKEGSVNADVDLLKNQFALTTWTIQSCANALAGNVWDMDNEL